jgi:hypothetical protein
MERRPLRQNSNYYSVSSRFHIHPVYLHYYPCGSRNTRPRLLSTLPRCEKRRNRTPTHDPRPSPPTSPMHISSTSCYWCTIRYLRCHNGRGIRNICRSSGRVMLQETLARDISCRRSNTSTSTLSHLSTETPGTFRLLPHNGEVLMPQILPCPTVQFTPSLIRSSHTK